MTISRIFPKERINLQNTFNCWRDEIAGDFRGIFSTRKLETGYRPCVICYPGNFIFQALQHVNPLFQIFQSIFPKCIYFWVKTS